MRRNNRGFSLVELIIVIAIMAVLVAVLVPTLLRYVEQSRQKADLTAVDEIITCVRTAYTSEEFAPTEEEFVLEIDTQGANQLQILNTCGDDTKLNLALARSEVADASLKSKEWGRVRLRFEVVTSGALKVKVSSDGPSGGRMEQQYNK